MLIELLDKLEEERVKNGWSQTDLASKLGISGNYLYRLRAGDRNPGVPFLSIVMREFPHLKPLVISYMENSGNHQE
jgi:transcriptional regulator with XRE-family HTH domain